jgi:hypothetical protein
MRSFALRLATVAVLLAAGGGLVAARPDRPAGVDGAGDGAGHGTGEVAATAAKARGRSRCNGLTRREVRGTEPTYSRQRLARFRNHERMCWGIWLPRPRRHLVPQGLAVSGRTAWVSGYRHRKGYGERPCQLVRVDLRTGRRLAFHRAIYGRVGKRPRTYCRHGGGILQRGKWLWVVEASKLWLVDPSQRRTDLQARRAWRIEAPVRGSAVVATGRSIGLVPFRKEGRPRLYWFSVKKLMRPGVLDLAVRSRGRHQLGAHSSIRVPRLVQGATLGPGKGLYLARSNLGCGELVTPAGRRVGFIPGAEGIELGAAGRRLWAVSESGSRPYARLGKPLTPAVASFAWPHLSRSKRAGCGFRSY